MSSSISLINCKKEDSELDQEGASNSLVEKNSGSTSQTQVPIINKNIRKKRRKTIKVHNKLPKLPERSTKLFFDYILHDKDQSILISPIQSVQFYKNISSIQINTEVNAVQINFEEIEIESEEPTKIYERLSKVHTTNALQVYKSLEHRQEQNRQSDNDTRTSTEIPEQEKQRPPQITEVIKGFMQNCSLVMAYNSRTLQLDNYFVSNTLLNLMGFPNQAVFTSYMLKKNFPLFSVPEDYSSYICESFRQLQMEYEYQFRSKLYDIYGNCFSLQEKITSRHFKEDGIILISHQYLLIDQQQQITSFLIANEQVSLLSNFNKFKAQINDEVDQFLQKYNNSENQNGNQILSIQQQQLNEKRTCKYRQIQ